MHDFDNRLGSSIGKEGCLVMNSAEKAGAPEARDIAGVGFKQVHSIL